VVLIRITDTYNHGVVVLDKVVARRKPTQGDVAKLADVSQATVSYVLSGTSAVSVPPETRQRILDAASELGYAPNMAARTLRTRKTMTIAGVIPDITNPFYPWLERGIQDVAETGGYDLITFNTDGDHEKELKALRLAREGRVDGLIITLFHLTVDDLQPLVSDGVAVVVLGPPMAEFHDLGIDTAGVDNEGAARIAVEHLLERGHKRIAMIAGVVGTPPRERRAKGYRDALAAHNLPTEERLIRAGEFSEEGGYEATRELLRMTPRPTAIFAANDLMAIGAMQALREAGVSVPDEMALAGFDDIPAAALVHPSLTTIDQVPHHLGQTCAQLLLQRLSNQRTGPGSHTGMPFRLIVREST
jgi:LacI family transcriptional regulator